LGKALSGKSTVKPVHIARNKGLSTSMIRMSEKTVKNAAESPKVLRQAVATLNAENFCERKSLLSRWVICGNSAVKSRGE